MEAGDEAVPEAEVRGQPVWMVAEAASAAQLAESLNEIC